MILILNSLGDCGGPLLPDFTLSNLARNPTGVYIVYNGKGCGWS